MITVESSKKSTDLMLKLMNTFREKPITLQGFKNQRAMEVKSNKASYDSSTGGLVPFSTPSEISIHKGCMTSKEIIEILDEEG
ncbi:MAG TPA: hypothetical protein IAA26_00860 [Candidatus Blautia faecipullorum]|nr:hypothetical protein [Candidatus Blautia faecipullorum]